MRSAGPRADEQDEGLPSYLIMTRLLFGWAFLALGVLNLAMGVSDARYLVFHVVALLAGVALLAAGMLRKRPTRVAWVTGAVVAAGGLLISMLPRGSATTCCLSGYDKAHGFPFTLLAEKSGHWHLDGPRTVVDLAFWACIGMFVLFAVTATAPAPAPAATGRHEAPAPARHAEPSAETVDDENVRGLP